MRFDPVNTPLRGQLVMPGDKSISQRIIFLASMAEGTSHIYDIPHSHDVMTATDVVRQLGATVRITTSRFSNERNIDVAITGWGKKGPQAPNNVLYCGNSATCARVGMGVLTPFDIKAVFDGDDSLHHRPFMRVVDPLMQMGAQFKVVSRANGRPQRSSLPLQVSGASEPNPLYYEMPVASSQVKTSILFAGANVEGATEVTEPYQSRDHGERLLKVFGADVDIDQEMNRITVNGPSRLKARDVHIPGDVSSAAYYLTAASLVPGSKITIKNVGLNETRLGFIRALQRMGARIDIKYTDTEKLLASGVDYCGEPVGDITAQYAGRLHAVEVNVDEVPQLIDEIPILAFAAACAEGKSEFYGVKELRLKECNRIHAISEGLRQLGTCAIDKGDTLLVDGGIDIEAKRSIKPVKDVVKLNHHGDHRLAIVWALAGLCGYTSVEEDDFNVSNVSYPYFVGDFNKLVM